MSYIDAIIESKRKELSDKSNYYRLTYNGIGIYEAFKQSCSSSEWKDFLNSDAAQWLPKPKVYNNKNLLNSYFTKDGYIMFMKKTYPVFIKKLYIKLIKTDICNISGNIVYKDKYQIVVENLAIKESILFNEKDIYYNKDKFDSGEINLCFITGHGGSGKSTMGKSMSKNNIEHIDLDNIIYNWRYYNGEISFKNNILVSDFFIKGPGKKYYGISKEEALSKYSNYIEDIVTEFVNYAINYSENNKSIKIVIEGVWIYLYIDPELLKKYAVYIKGTSAIVSIFRAIKRDYQNYKDKSTIEKVKKSIDRLIKKLNSVIDAENAIKKYRNYFNNDSINESDESILELIKSFNEELSIYEYIIVNTNGSIIDQIKQDSFKNYKTLSPEKFKKFKGGICWDYVAYEWRYFKSHFSNIKIKTFYFAIIKNGIVSNTHTFLLFYINDKVYWFEASWKSHIGIIEYNSENEALSDIINTLKFNNKNDWFIVEYNAGDNKYINITDTEYINQMNTLPEYNFKYLQKVIGRKIIQSIKLDNSGNIINESVSTKQIQLYFISTKENIKSLSPRIPDNFFTRKGYEDNKTPRVCFSTDIGKCLMGLSSRCEGQKYYVYKPIGEYEVITPTKKQVPDVEITDEKWICEKVEVECIGEILCICDKGEDGIPYTYGPNDEYKAELYEWNWKWTKKYKSTIQESVSTIDKDFKSKGKKSLSNFKKVHITETIIDKYKKEYPMLRHVRCKDTKDYICDGYIWLDNDKLVCMVGSCEYTDDNTKWIVSLEIMKDYRGYGLSSQILDYAVKNMNCKYLSVNKKNEVAKRIYDNYGFKVYHEDDTMYYMTIDINKL